MTPTDQLGHFAYWEAKKPTATFLRTPDGANWKTWSWAEVGAESRKIAGGLRQMGLAPGDHIAILSKNCPHWLMADLAIQMVGCITIPIYPSLSASGIEEILVHSEAKAIVVGKLDNFGAQASGIPTSCSTIGVNAYGYTGANSWEGLLAEASPLEQLYTWKPNEVFTIIYTSGTTGKSKGVMHRMQSFDQTVKAVGKRLELPSEPRMFSYLPLSHIAERMAICYNGFVTGAEISFAESLASFAKNLADTQPEIFVGVPRIYSKFREGVLLKIPQKKLTTLLRIPLLGSYIKKNVRKKLGLHQVKTCLTGAAPIAAELQAWFYALDINILQVYGMTEDCVYAHMNGPHDNAFGTVGKPLPGLQVKFGPDGDVRVKSVGNFLGYYKQPDVTAETFDEDGFLLTGDVGEYDADGNLRLTGRVKDQFKTDKGKYIAPAPIELKLLTNPLIEQACIVGTGIPQPIALLVLNEIGNKMTKENLQAELSGLINQINLGLEKHEKLEKGIILKTPWSIENGMLTPTLKVKRNEVEKLFVGQYGNWYQSKDKIAWQ